MILDTPEKAGIMTLTRLTLEDRNHLKQKYGSITWGIRKLIQADRKITPPLSEAELQANKLRLEKLIHDGIEAIERNTGNLPKQTDLAKTYARLCAEVGSLITASELLEKAGVRAY
jgi:hypothetical protein